MSEKRLECDRKFALNEKRGGKDDSANAKMIIKCVKILVWHGGVLWLRSPLC